MIQIISVADKYTQDGNHETAMRLIRGKAIEFAKHDTSIREVAACSTQAAPSNTVDVSPLFRNQIAANNTRAVSPTTQQPPTVDEHPHLCEQRVKETIEILATQRRQCLILSLSWRRGHSGKHDWWWVGAGGHRLLLWIAFIALVG